MAIVARAEKLTPFWRCDGRYFPGIHNAFQPAKAGNRIAIGASINGSHTKVIDGMGQHPAIGMGGLQGGHRMSARP